MTGFEQVPCAHAQNEWIQKTLSAHRCSFQKCLCVYFIHVVANTVESW